jgi:hypothetical protein
VGPLDPGPVRVKPWIALAIVGGALLAAAWLAWAIYVASDHGLNRGIGVRLAWPALVRTALVICLPLVGIYLLVRPREPTADEHASPSEGGRLEPAEAQATETR